MNTQEALAEFEAQGILSPGQEGWWKVWGARPIDIRPGDLVFTQDEVDLIEDTYLAKNAPLRIGIVADGKRFTLGALTSCIIVRRGTHNTLA